MISFSKPLQNALSFLFVILFTSFGYTQPNNNNDYKKIFGRSFTDALDYYNYHKTQFYYAIKNENADPNVLIPVIFPELIRFNVIQDKVETLGLIVFYTNMGNSYANFSIGRFQMKPSFVEALELDALHYGEKIFKEISDFGGEKDEKRIREIRVGRLEDTNWQLKYLCAFYHSLINRFEKEIAIMSLPEKVLFFSSAYNGGYSKPYEKIIETQYKRFFPNGNSNRNNQYSYSEVALDFYNRYLAKIY